MDTTDNYNFPGPAKVTASFENGLVVELDAKSLELKHRLELYHSYDYDLVKLDNITATFDVARVGVVKEPSSLTKEEKRKIASIRVIRF